MWMSVTFLFALVWAAHGQFESDHNCGAHRQSVEDLRNQSEYPPLGLSVPNCHPNDIDYAPIQCTGSVCFCVDPYGIAIDDFRDDRWTEASMDCKCALAKRKHENTGLIGKKFRCTANGSYEPQQCTGSVCYCVDSDGIKQEHLGEKGIWEMNNLDC